MHWFKFKGISSSMCNVQIEDYIPQIIPENKQKFINVPGKDGSLAYGDASLNDIMLTLNCVIKSSFAEELRMLSRRISLWLKGYGDLSLWDDANIVRKAHVYSPIQMASFDKFGKFQVKFRCEPFSLGQEISVPIGGEVLIDGTAPAVGIISANVPAKGTDVIFNVSKDNNIISKISLSGEVNASDLIIINLEENIIKINNINANKRISLNSRFFSVPTGKIKLTATYKVNNVLTSLSSAKFIYRPRWY